MSRSTTPIARKEHRCDYCGYTIEKGEMYRKFVALPGEYGWDDFTVFKSHRFCSDLARDYHDRYGLCSDEGVDFQEALSELWEEWGLERYLSSWARYEEAIGYHQRCVQSKWKDKGWNDRAHSALKNTLYRFAEIPRVLMFDDEFGKDGDKES